MTTTKGATMQKTYTLGELTVTVEGPEALATRGPLITYRAEDERDFDAIVEAVGGPGAFHQPSGDYAMASSGDGLHVLLYAPAPTTVPVDQPTITRLRERQEQAQETAAA